jgi:tetratricopeptide (TPR) repeat protein
MSSVAMFVAEYRLQYRADPETADCSLLDQGRALLDAHRKERTLQADIVHAGFDLLDCFGECPTVVDLLRQYLGQPLTPDERAWAWWQLVDSLSVLHRCEEVVREHKALWHWAIQNLDGYRLNLAEAFPYHPFGSGAADGDETIAPEVMRLWVMHDGTQAKCWVEAGQAGEWRRLAQEAIAATPSTRHNRHQRFNFLRTLGVVAAWSGQYEAGLDAAQQVAALADEETDWELQQRWRIEGLYVAMRVHTERKDQTIVRQLGEQAIELVDAIEQRCDPLTTDQRRRLGSHAHNIACPLRGMAQYDLAIPLFERAIALDSASAWTIMTPRIRTVV